MLTAKQIRNKIFRSAEEFKSYISEKKWSQAKHAYDRASAMAVFMELPEEDMAALFGNRAYREDSEPVERGLFDEELVRRAYDECIRLNQTFEVKPYPGNPNRVKDYGQDVWSREGTKAQDSAYGGFEGTA
ncbi:MAG: hypothetical protein NC548_33335 [Lachnospiraceae bacterium]|nr:hypothetical protein [Lachnospiraceae bacterium]